MSEAWESSRATPHQASRQMSRAPYRNSVARDSRGESRQPYRGSRHRQGLSKATPIAGSPGTRPETVELRGNYIPSDNHVSQTSDELQSYLHKTGVQEIFKENLHTLLDRSELPYNPYPGYCQRIRISEERFHLLQESSDVIHRHLDNKVEETRVNHLYTLTNHEGFYGLPSILRTISPPTLEKYRWLVSDLTPVTTDLPTSTGYSTHVTSALVGPCVFEGSLYPEVHNVHIRLELIIAGADQKEAHTVFVNQVLYDIEETGASGHHVVHQVIVPTSQKPWSLEQVISDKDAFIRELLQCVKENKYIYLEGVFLLDPNSTNYMCGQKQYGLNFLQVYDEPESEDLLSFCEFPMGSLHEGIFFDEAQAEGYVKMFEMDDVNSHVTCAPEVDFSEFQDPVTRSYKGRGTYTMKDDRSKRTVLIDGFRFKDDASLGAFAWQITTPIRAHYQKKIAGLWPHTQLLDIVYCAVILATMDSNVYEKTGMMEELYRLLHGTAGLLHHLMEHNRRLANIIQTMASKYVDSFIITSLEKFQSALANVFMNPLIERSHEFVFIGIAALAKLDDIKTVDDLDVQNCLDTLAQIHDLMVPLLMDSAETSLTLLPNMNELILQTETLFPEQNPRPAVRYITKAPVKPAPPRRTGFISFLFEDSEEEEEEAEVEYVEEYPHGQEDDRIIAHETSVLVVEECVVRDVLTPQQIAVENVLMQYMLDCHIDDVWSDYLLELAGGDLFPPNPYPRLISVLRQSAIRMDLCMDTQSETTERMFNLDVKLEDAENFVYRVPDVDAFGCVTSLMLFDAGAMAQVLDIVTMFQQKSYIQKKGSFRVGICMALSGPSIWYGRMVPYLNVVLLHEHYYIQGPAGCHGDVIELCALIVYTHVLELMESPEILVIGVYFGGPSAELWNCYAIRNKKRAFMSQFSYICSAGEDIVVKCYVVLDTWRYVPVNKKVKLHFMEKNNRVHTFFQEQPEELYQSLFLSKERVAFFRQNCGLPSDLDPMLKVNVTGVAKLLETKMAASYRCCDWMNFYRHLLLRDLLLQDQTKITDCWMMFHSIAGQIDYIVGLLENLAELVEYQLESETHVGDVTDGKKKQTKKKSTKDAGEAQIQNKYLQNNKLELSLLDEMTRAVYDKLRWICEARILLTSKGFGPYVLDLINQAMKFDPDTNFPELEIEAHTPPVLRQASSLLRPLIVTLGSDVLKAQSDIEETPLINWRSEVQDPRNSVGPSATPGFKINLANSPVSPSLKPGLIRPNNIRNVQKTEDSAYNFPPRYMTLGE